MLTIADFAPNHEECGVGLVIQDDSSRYLFVIAGTRHFCLPGELFYAGIGGHRENGEDWLECAQREAMEEIKSKVEIISAPKTWYISRNDPIQQLEIVERPRPFAFYEMIHPTGTPRAGELYHLVIYKARNLNKPKALPKDEVLGIIALTPEQVVRGPERKPTLCKLIKEGAAIITGEDIVDFRTRLYPLGTAVALAKILKIERS